MKNRQLILATFAVGVVLIATGCGLSAGGKDGFPERKVSVIVPWAAGGATDAIARLWAKCFEDELGQSVTVLNIEEGAGAAGSLKLAEAKPDGYTVGVETMSPTVIVPTMESNVGYDFKDFEFLGHVGTSPDVIYTNAKSQYKTIDDFLQSVDKGVKVAGYHERSASQFRGEAFQHNNGYSWTTVPYETSDEVLRSVLGGDTEVGYDLLSEALLKQAESGAVRILAASGDVSSVLPNVPTYEELGRENFGGSPDTDAVNYYLVAPVGIPEDVTDVWARTVSQCRDSKDLGKQLRVKALPKDGITGDEAVEHANKEAKAYRDFIEKYKPGA